MNFLKFSFKGFFKTVAIIILPILIVFVVAQAGSLTPLAAPAATSYTLSDIYTRLTTNASATAGNHSFSATTTPTSTFQTLTDIYNSIPTIYASDFLATSTYLGVTGSIAVKSGDASASVSATSTNKLLLTPAAGYYNGTTATVSTTTSDFDSANILSGKYIFGLAGSIPVKTSDNAVTTSATSTNILKLTPPLGYYNGSSATVSTTSTAFTASNIKLGTYLLGIVGTLYGDTDASKVLATASAAGTIPVIAGNTAVASSSIQGTSFVLTVPQGYYSGADSVTVSTSSINMFVNQKFQTKDDWVNSDGTTGEYTAEEATWTTVSGSPFSGYNTFNYLGATNLYSGSVKQDTRTGLWWSDIMAVGSTASTTTNVFGNATDGTRPTGGQAIGFCDALNTASFAGYNDWYLPTQKQLQQTYIDGAANNLPSPGYYFWSSTEYYFSTASAWSVALNNGSTVNLTKVSSYYVRCVRS